ncbi:MAG: glutamate-ammonia-ligase adenylyltransferase [Gammaproteobacteria bacterium]|nr:glutamate-ammonia-ligase adenylyltransferase [Gammaproteobacteria bacterium]
MDKFTRNYSIVLGVVVVALVALFMYEDPQVQSLNDRLLRDTRLSTYPYNFRVLRLENGVATMTTPRSAEFPAYRALGLLFPSLDGLPQDDARLMQGQLDMAQLQEYAKGLVLDTEAVKHVAWELDTQWLDRHGIEIIPDN